jgi:hypothetical protein
MTCIIDTKSKRLSAKLLTGLAISAVLVLGTLAVPAHAQDYHRDDHRGGPQERRDDRGGHRDWGGGYYSAPPVIYGTPYYAPPPVVYGAGIGIEVPGISVNIR